MLALNVDAREILGMAGSFERAGKNMKPAIRRALNHTGDKAKTQVIRALTTQTGLKRKTVVKAVRRNAASDAGLVYELKAKGGNISLKYFGARETRSGVSAAPWNRRQAFKGAFMKGGRFPNRVALSLGGHAFARKGKPRLPITLQKSGLFIPKEMVTGASAAAFQSVAATALRQRLEHELSAILGGNAPGGR